MAGFQLLHFLWRVEPPFLFFSLLLIQYSTYYVIMAYYTEILTNHSLNFSNYSPLIIRRKE